MSKSIKMPDMRPGGPRFPGPSFPNPAAAANLVEGGIRAASGIVNIITTIGEERRKTQELKLEEVRIRAEIEDKISQRENETMRIIKQYEIELKKIDSDMKSAELQFKKDMKKIDFDMEIHTHKHKERMKELEIIEKIIDVSLDQYKFYRENGGYGYNTVHAADTERLYALNDAIQRLSVVIASRHMSSLPDNH